MLPKKSERQPLLHEEVINLSEYASEGLVARVDTPQDPETATADATNAVTESEPSPKPATQENINNPVLSLGWWNTYFLGKLALYWYSVIAFHPLENLAFALALLAPIKGRWLARLRTIVAIPAAIVLAYYDSWLPPFERLVAQASLVATFSWQYLFEIVGRFINGSVLLALVSVLAAYPIVAKRLRVGSIVILTLVALVIADTLPQHPNTQAVAATNNNKITMPATDTMTMSDLNSDLDTLFNHHFQKEAARQVQFNPTSSTAVPFDLVFLHICSLSWDDLAALGLTNHPLFARFDILLTRFNSISTYSGPAVIRLLRAPCGQSNHTGLYEQAPEHCYLLPELHQAGFEPNLVLNHDGHFDDLLGLIHKQGAQGLKPMSIEGLPIRQRGFDDSPIYDDLAVLNRWLDTVESGTATRVAAFYNSISLHDGNKIVGGSNWRSSTDTYKTRLEKLLNDIDSFITRLEHSKRRMVIALIPEHGAAIRGDKMQISGMREIPTPAITLVPVGVKVIGSDAHRSGSPVQIDAPTSYLAVSHILSRMLANSPFDQPQFNPQQYVTDLPTARYVAENAGMVMMEHGDRYYLHMPKTDWREYVLAPETIARTP